MTDLEIMLQLNDNGVTDNPFDLMVNWGIELLRDTLFGCQRIGNDNVPDSINTSEESLRIRFSKIMDEFNRIQYLDKEVVTMLRKTSFFGNYDHNDEFFKFNDLLIKFKNFMETRYSRCTPVYDKTFEKYKYGEKSFEYKRYLELIDLCNKEPFLSISKDTLFEMMDAIERPEEGQAYFQDPKTFSRNQKLINDFNLTSDEIEFIISFKFERYDVKKGELK